MERDEWLRTAWRGTVARESTSLPTRAKGREKSLSRARAASYSTCRLLTGPQPRRRGILKGQGSFAQGGGQEQGSAGGGYG